MTDGMERAVARTKHGMYGTPEHKAWEGMKGRCFRKKYKGYQNYGGRGITVCQEWVDSFVAFYAHIGPRPSPKHSLDRYPNRDGNYEPGNVRWATPIEQANNKRTNRIVDFRGQQVSIAEAVRLAGSIVPRDIAKDRVGYGWSIERAVTAPVLPNGDASRFRRHS